MIEEGRGLPGGLGMKYGNPVGEGLLESQNWERVIFSITSLTRIGPEQWSSEQMKVQMLPVCQPMAPPSEFTALFFPYLSSSRQNIYCVSNGRQKGMERHREAGSWLQNHTCSKKKKNSSEPSV